MEKKRAQKLIGDVFSSPFNLERYTGFLRELLNDVTPRGNRYSGQVLPSAYSKHISQYWRIGKYIDPEGEELDLLAVEVKSVRKLYQARTALRNFAVNRLKQFEKEAALIAFYSNEDGGEDWRFSYVRIEQEAYKDDTGRVKLKEDLTPARRYSYLVGVHESAHTAASQLLPILTMDYAEPLLEDIESAFSIEKVTEEFFEQYKTLFINLSEELSKQPYFKAVKSDLRAEEVSRFSKKLLGQIVFLFFLQKKGWLGVGKTQKWGDGQRNFLHENLKNVFSKEESYFTDFLQHLFYEALADERKGQKDPTYYNKFECRIPFLNGGLFEAEYNWKSNPIQISNALFHNQERNQNGDVGTGILDVFDRYNFTIKEDEPLDREVAVDPEMLGKVFENMLEITERKSKGAFYTPREIVHYICQESLINYLDNHLNAYGETHQDIDTNQGSFFGNESRSGQLKLSQSNEVIKVPRNEIEAFVRRGHLTLQNDELVQAKGKETKDIRFQLSAAIRKNADVIDVALSDVRVCDPAIGSGAFPVGLLHEIVTLRQVLATHLGNKLTSYDFKRHAISKSLYGVDIDASAVDIARLRLWLSLIVDEDDYDQIEALPNLDYKIIVGNALVGYPQNWSSQISTEIDLLKKEFLRATDSAVKANLKKQIEHALAARKANSEKVFGAHVEFDFRLYFSEIWNEKDGFDIVIGNPPYVQIQKFSGQSIQKAWESQQYESYVKSGDVYCLFYEQGHRLLNADGVLAYITSNKWMKAKYGVQLRKFLSMKCKTISIIDFASHSVFKSATVDTNILFLGKGETGSHFKAAVIPSNYDNRPLATFFEENYINLENPSTNSWVVRTKDNYDIFKKIEASGKTIKELKVSMNRGIVTGLNEVFIVDKPVKEALVKEDPKSRDLLQPVLLGKHIKRYKVTFQNHWMVATYPARNIKIENYPAIKRYLKSFGRRVFQTGEAYIDKKTGESKKSRKATSNDWFETQDQISYFQAFESENITWGNLALSAQFALSPPGMCINAPSSIISGCGRELLAILNSQVSDYYIRSLGVTRSGGYFEYKPMFVEQLPVPDLNENLRMLLANLANYVLLASAASMDLHRAFFENVIDGLVFELYFPDELSKTNKQVVKHLGQVLPLEEKMSEEEKLAIISREFDRLYDPEYELRTAIDTLDSVNVVKTIRNALKR